MNSRHIDLKDWEAELQTRRGYHGYSLDPSAPERLAVDQLLPTLPAQGVAATIDIRRFCTGRVREVIDDPTLLFTPQPPSGPVRTNLWVEPGEEESLAVLYSERGILAEVPPEVEVLRHDNGELLEAGNFGVVNKKKKPIVRAGADAPLSALRSVFNLIPQNNALLPFDGDTLQMPISSQRANMVLLSRELALQVLEDRESFFYLFVLPLWWIGVQVTRYKSGRGLPLGLRSLGMGLKAAVPIAEHVHRNIVRSQQARSTLSGIPLGESPGLAPEAEIRKDRPTPFTVLLSARDSWLAYIDDLNINKIIVQEEYEMLKDCCLEQGEVADQRYHLANTPGDKAVKPGHLVKVLGERSDGALGRREAPEDYSCQCIDMFFFMAEGQPVQQVGKQMLGGRWNRICFMRRELSTFFECLWPWVQDERATPMPEAVFDEFMQASMLAFLGVTSLRHPVSDLVVASDSSKTGGAVCASHGMTGLGLEVGWEQAFRSHQPSSEELLLITLGDPVGAVRRTLELDGRPVAAAMAWVKGTPDRRVVKRAYPDTEVFEACQLETPQAVLRDWLKSTSLRQVRATSLLVYVLSDSGEEEEIAVFLDVLSQALREVDWDLKVTAACESHREPEVPEGRGNPWHCLEASAVSSVERSRWYAASKVWRRPWVHKELRWFKLPPLEDVTGAPGVCSESWIEDQDLWHFPAGRKVGPLLPVRRLNKSFAELTAQAAEMSWETPEQRERWIAEGGRQCPGACLAQKCLTNKEVKAGEATLVVAGTMGRLVRIEEWERLFSLAGGHTVTATASGRHKEAASKTLRLKLLSKSPFPRLSWHVLQQQLSALGFGHLQDAAVAFATFCERERRNQLLDSPILGLQPDMPPVEEEGWVRGWAPGQRLVVGLFNSAGSRGTDVHMMSGSFMRPEAAHSRTIQPALWHWRSAFTWEWNLDVEDHINVLELRAALNGLRWRLRSRKAVGCLCLSLTDSAVTAAVVAKHRSSSRAIQRILRKWSALVLASSTRQGVGFVRSDLNPADAGSRKGQGFGR